MTAAPATQPRNNRSAWIEWTRVIACIGVVWYHADGPYKFLSPAAMIAFVIMGCAFIKRLESVSRFGAAFTTRAQRLMLPWLIWSVIYGALRCAEALRNGEPLFSWWEPRMWLYGTWVHLWFLPMLFFVTIIVLLLDVAEIKLRRKLVEPFGWLLVIGSPLWVQLELMNLGKPFHQWSAVVTAVGLGVLMREVKPGDAKARKRVALILVVHAAALSVAYLTMAEHTGYLLKHALGAVALFAWIPLVKGSRIGLALGALTMGVYLVHPLIINAFVRLPELPFGDGVRAAIIVVLSYLAAYAITVGVRVFEFSWRRVRPSLPAVALQQPQAPSS